MQAGGLSSFHEKYPFVVNQSEPGSWTSFEQVSVSWPSRITRYIYLGEAIARPAHHAMAVTDIFLLRGLVERFE